MIKHTYSAEEMAAVEREALEEQATRIRIGMGIYLLFAAAFLTIAYLRG